MNQKLSINLNNPCNQKFDTFQSTNKGGFCTSCNKEVIDFRKYTDSELINHLNNNEEKICGLFMSHQLKTYSESNWKQNTTPKKSFYNSIFGFSLLSFLTLNNGYSQTQEKSTTVLDANRNKDNKVTISKSIDELTIGIVYDEAGPIPGVNVAVKNSDLKTSSGFDGKFSFKKLKIGDVLIVSFIGMKTKEVLITEHNYSNIKIVLDTYNYQLMGEVEVKKIYKSKKTFWQKIKNLFND